MNLALHILRNAKFLQGMMFLLCLSSCSTLFAASTPLPGEIAYWRLDEAAGSTTAADSVGGNTGTLFNGPTFNTGLGQVNGALIFDGNNDYVDCGNSPALNLSGDMSCSAWIYMTANNRDQKIVAKQDVNTGTGGYKMGVYTDNKFEFEIRDAANNAFLSRSVAGGTVLATNTWYHVVGVYSAGNYIRTYVNGVLDRELLLTNLCGATSTNFVIGKEGGSAQYFWQGRLDDIHFINRAISATEVTALYRGYTVDAGLDQVLLTYPGTANLAGTATWIVEPNPAWTLSPTWSRVAGPGTVTYAPNPPNAYNVAATYNTAGTHQMRLSVACSNGRNGSDDMLVTSLKMWDGGDAASNNWTVNNNWTGTAPVAGDPLIFGAAGAARKATNTNNFAANTAFGTIFFVDNGYTLSGNAIDLNSGIQTSNTTGTNTIALGLRLQGDQTFSSGVAGTTLNINGALNLNAYTLTLAGPGDFVINGVVSGSGRIYKTGTGTVTFAGNNTYTGVTQVDAGTVIVTNNNGLGSNTGATVINSGATLQVQNNITSSEALTLSGTGNGGIGALRNNGNDTLSGLVQLGANTTIQNASGTLTMSGGIVTNTFVATFDGASNTTESGVVSGTGGITKNGAATLTLSGASTYTGATTINAGIVNIQNATALGTTAAGTSVATGATLQIQGGIAVGAEALTLNGSGTGAIGALENVSGNNSMSGAITLASASEIASDAGTLTLSGNVTNGGFLLTTDGAGNVTESGAISGTGGLTKNGSGTLTLSGNSSYSGATQLNTGTTQLLSNNGLGAAGTGTTVASGATLFVDGTITSAEPLSIAGTGNGGVGVIRGGTNSNTLSGAITQTAASLIYSQTGALNLTGGLNNGGFDTTFDNGGGDTLESGVISGAGNVIKNGAGILTFSGAASNTYGGITTVNAGELDLNKTAGQNAIPGTLIVGDNAGGASADIVRLQASDQIPVTSAITVTSSGLLSLGAFNDTIGAITLNSGTASGANVSTTTGTLTLGGNVDLTVVGTGANGAAVAGNLALGGATRTVTVANGTAAADLTISSLISNGGGASGLTKSGPGTLVLSGGATNTYTGTTTVLSGQLDLSKTATFVAVPAALVIGDDDGTAGNDIVRETIANQIADTAAVTVTSSGLLNLNGLSDTIGTLTMNSGSTSGASVTTGAGTLTLGGNVALNVFGTGATEASITGLLALAGNRTFTIANGTGDTDLLISAVVSNGGGTRTLTKDGAGTLELGGVNTYTGNTTVNAGTLLVNGSTATSPTTTVSGGTLGGSGTVGVITATSGKVSPGGANAGQTGSVGNLAARTTSFSNTTTFEIESTGSAAGSFDSLQVTTANADTVTLGNAVLSVLAAPGTYTADMVIINNAGGDAVVGTFNGLAAGATVNGGGQYFQISYNSFGAGNDVVLRPIPTVNNVTSSTANGIYGIGAVISIQVTFSQNITVTGTPRLTLETGTTDAVLNFVNVTGGNTMNFTYTVAAGHTSPDLDYISTAALALNGGTITGTGPGALAANLTLPAPGATNSLGGNKNIEIDTSAPQVINVTSPNADGIYTTGGVIDVQVQFDDIVFVTGTPRIQLETGTADVQANYVSGTGTDTLTFRFTVAAGHYTPDLNYLATNSLTLNGGTINDGVNNAVLTLPALAGVGSLATNKNIIISTPVITARQTQDTDGNGFIDAIRIVTDQPLFDNFTGLNVTVAGYALAGASYDTGGTANDNEFFVRLTEGPAPDTDKTPSVTVVAGGNLLIPTDTGVTPVDAARPVLMTSLWTDASGGGVTATDSILLTFSEPVLSNNCFAVALLGTPVTGDNLDASSTIPATVVASYNITVTLGGNPILTPGGNYSNTLTVPGSPTGLYVIPVVGSPDPLGNANVFDPVGNLAHVQTFGTAIDLGPTSVNVAIAWDDLTITSKLWNIGVSDVGQVHTAFAAFPPSGLVARNVGNVRAKFTVSCTGSAPAGWALASAAAANAFEMKVDASTPLDAVYELDLGTGPKDIVNQLYSGHNKPFDLRFATPTSISSGAGVSQDITVTITITQD